MATLDVLKNISDMPKYLTFIAKHYDDVMKVLDAAEPLKRLLEAAKTEGLLK